MCFKPKHVPSKKVVLVELERAKVTLEQENGALRAKLKDLQDSAARAHKDRDSIAAQRADLEAQLQQRTSRTAQVLTHVSYLRSNLSTRLEDLLNQHFAAASVTGVDAKAPHPPASLTASVRVIQSDCLEDDDLHAGAVAAALDPTDAKPPPKASTPSHPTTAPTSDDPVRRSCATGRALQQQQGDPPQNLSIEQQLDSELELLARAQDQALVEASALQAKLRKAEGHHAELRADAAGARRRLEQAEANASDQQQVLQLRCAALEQENEQLTGMSDEMKRRLEDAEGELSSSRKQWTADVAQLSKQASELGSTSSRLREAEAEVRSLQAQLAAAAAQAQEASLKAADLQDQAADRASSLEAASAALAARELELAESQAQARQLAEQLSQLQEAKESLAIGLRDLTASKRATEEALDLARAQLAEAQREAAAAAQQAAAAQHLAAKQSQALAEAETQLQESRASLATTSERLSRALADLAATECKLSEASSQVLTTKQSVISTAKQLASMAKDHSAALAKLHALEVEAAALREQAAASRDAEASLRTQAQTSSAAAREARDAAAAATAEAGRLRVAYDAAAADLRRKIMLLTAIARMADKGGQAAAGGGRSQVADPADGYGAVTSEQRLRLKVCESPLPLLGALTAGIMDSSRLRHLSLDMDTSREVTWEKAGLRICCLAAAIGLNNSLQTLQLGGWTWGELGNGTALPFLALGGGAAAGSGGAGGMLRSVRLATNLFDVEAAAMLRDLLAAGLVELAAGGGGTEGEEDGSAPEQQGTLRLYSGNERLDGWYSHMLQLASKRLPPANTAGVTPAEGLLAHGPGSFRGARPSTAGGDAPSTASNSVSPSSSFARLPDASTSFSSASASYPHPNPASSAGGAAAAASASAGGSYPNLECDLAAEALESHHMVLVMTVLLRCPGLRRLRLDGNKLGDGGAALLALGLASNTGLRELYLSRNGIRAAGARSLARCLEGSNSTLLRLDLSGQRLEGLGPAGAEAMAQALRINRTLEDLNLSSCGLAGAAATCFAGAIRVAGATTRPADRPASSSSSSTSAGGADSHHPHHRGLASRESLSSLGAISGGGGVCTGGGALRRLALAGNGIDAATAQVLQAAAAERPGLVLTL